MEVGKGLLTLKVEEAELQRNTEMMGSMSPYCTLVFKNNKLKTKIHNYGGKKPVWGDEFVLEVEDPSEELALRVWDQDLTSSDAVGWCKIKMSSLIINNGVDDWFEVMYDNRPAGKVRFTTTFEPEGGDAYEQLQEKFNEQTAKLEQEAEEAKAKAEELAEQQEQLQEELAQQQAKIQEEREENQRKLEEAQNNEDMQAE